MFLHFPLLAPSRIQHSQSVIVFRDVVIMSKSYPCCEAILHIALHLRNKQFLHVAIHSAARTLQALLYTQVFISVKTIV